MSLDEVRVKKIKGKQHSHSICAGMNVDAAQLLQINTQTLALVDVRSFVESPGANGCKQQVHSSHTSCICNELGKTQYSVCVNQLYLRGLV